MSAAPATDTETRECFSFFASSIDGGKGYVGCEEAQAQHIRSCFPSAVVEKILRLSQSVGRLAWMEDGERKFASALHYGGGVWVTNSHGLHTRKFVDAMSNPVLYTSSYPDGRNLAIYCNFMASFPCPSHSGKLVAPDLTLFRMTMDPKGSLPPGLCTLPSDGSDLAVPSVGHPVVAIHFGESQDHCPLQITNGVICQVIEGLDERVPPLLFHTAATTFGSSGGALLHIIGDDVALVGMAIGGAMLVPRASSLSVAFATRLHPIAVNYNNLGQLECVDRDRGMSKIMGLFVLALASGDLNIKWIHQQLLANKYESPQIVFAQRCVSISIINNVDEGRNTYCKIAMKHVTLSGVRWSVSCLGGTVAQASYNTLNCVLDFFRCQLRKPLSKDVRANNVSLFHREYLLKDDCPEFTGIPKPYASLLDGALREPRSAFRDKQGNWSTTSSGEGVTVDACFKEQDNVRIQWIGCNTLWTTAELLQLLKNFLGVSRLPQGAPFWQDLLRSRFFLYMMLKTKSSVFMKLASSLESSTTHFGFITAYAQFTGSAHDVTERMFVCAAANWNPDNGKIHTSSTNGTDQHTEQYGMRQLYQRLRSFACETSTILTYLRVVFWVDPTYTNHLVCKTQCMPELRRFFSALQLSKKFVDQENFWAEMDQTSLAPRTRPLRR